jgi:hypothetical protein
MANARIVFNSEGFRQILLSDGCHDLVTQTAQDIQQRANANNNRGGDGFRTSVEVGGYGGGRWVGFVSTTDKKSKAAESEDKALTRALTE